MKIGVIGAMQMEVDNLQANMTDTKVVEYSGITFVEGKIDGKSVVAAKCGIGKVFAAICAQTMILEFNVDMIVNIGVAGSLTKDLSVFDVAVATNVVQHDMDTSALGDPVGLLSGINMVLLPADEKMVEHMCKCLKNKGINYKKGTIATGDQFVATKEKKDEIVDKFDAIAAEMEGGSIGHVCYVNNVPFTILRSISDSEGGAVDYATFAEKAAQQSIDVVIEFTSEL